jgi:1,4-alpha-glucan branching enzyme
MSDLLALAEYQDHFNNKAQRYENLKKALLAFYNVRSVNELADGYLTTGYHAVDGGVIFNEWFGFQDQVLKNITVSLIGDFNNHDPRSHVLTFDPRTSCHHIFIPNINNKCPIPDMSRLQYMVSGIMDGHNYQEIRIISGWAKHITPLIPGAESYNPDNVYELFWNPGTKYQWSEKSNLRQNTDRLSIYEFHIGMMNENGTISRYQDIVKLIPWIKHTGYNCVQLMGVPEHACYESFGYLCTNYFAPSSRAGSPDDFKMLVDHFHRHDIRVILDITHTHAANDQYPGLNHKLGDNLTRYFRDGMMTRWGSLFFNYTEYPVLRYLLSNLKWWITEYRIDGFRFDAVNEVIYVDGYVGKFSDYFEKANIDAQLYFMLANELLGGQTTKKISIAEDYFGLPGLCSSQNAGGLGFNYRQQTGIAEYFQYIFENHVMGTYPQFDINHIVRQLMDTRSEEKTIIYMESHDQQIMGHKTFIQNLLGPRIDHDMGVSNHDPYPGNMVRMLICLRLLVWSFQKGGMMTFAGNEFMHPGWLEYPTKKNGMDMRHAGRNWSLVVKNIIAAQNDEFELNDALLHGAAHGFERDFLHLDDSFFAHQAQSIYNGINQLIEVQRGPYVILINLSPRIIINYPVHIDPGPWGPGIDMVMDTAKYVKNQKQSTDNRSWLWINGKNQVIVKRFQPYTGVIFKFNVNKVPEPINYHENQETITLEEENMIEKAKFICYYTYDHWIEDEMIYLVTSIMSLIRELQDRVVIMVWTTTYCRVIEEFTRYGLDGLVSDKMILVKQYIPDHYNQTVRDVVAPGQKYFNCIGHARLYVTPSLLARFDKPVVYLDNDTGILRGKGKEFIDIVMNCTVPVGFRMEKWTTLYGLYDQMNMLRLIEGWGKNTHSNGITLIDKNMMPINNGILIFGNNKHSLDFSHMCLEIFEDLNESLPCKFNDMTAFSIVWYLMKGRCLLYNEFFRDQDDCYQYNGELVYDQPNYTAYHYYLEKYQDNQNILRMGRAMIDHNINNLLHRRDSTRNSNCYSNSDSDQSTRNVVDYIF